MKTPSVHLALPVVLAALLGQGCVYVSQSVREEKEAEVDQDGDGAPFGGNKGRDCDDLDPDRTPGAEEIPYDGIDNNCTLDPDVVDVDDDTYPGISLEEWEENTGRSADDDEPGGWPSGLQDEVDCVDQDVLDDDGNVVIAAAEVFPGSPAEVPYDGVDSDCDLGNDFDVDGDGYLPSVLPDGRDAEQAYRDYVELWGYEGRQNDWFPNSGGEPLFGDCDDSDPMAHPDRTDDVPYDGIDSDCDGVNDFDPDGDGYMPPILPELDDDGNVQPTEPAYLAYLDKYDLTFTLPDPVAATHPDSKSYFELGPFDDCLDLGDPRPGASAYDAASIYPRAWSASFDVSDDSPYDGIDADCNRDNDFDADRDAYNRVGDDTAYAEYTLFWGYEGEKVRWAGVNEDVALAEPGPDDCKDDDALTYPAALELIERTNPVDQDCDGDPNGSSFWFEGSEAGPIMEWSGITNPRFVRLGDVYSIIVGSEVLNQPAIPAPLSQNAGLAIPFPIDSARSRAVPSQPPFTWKSSSATQAIGPAMDAISVDRCRGPGGEELAYVYVEYITVGAFSTFFNWYSLKEAPNGRAITVDELGAIGSVSPEMVTQHVSINLDGNCNVVLAGIADNTLWLSHGAGLVADLPLFTDPTLLGSTVVATFDASESAASPPVVSFEMCETGLCSEHVFELSDSADTDPMRTLAEARPEHDWGQAASNWNKFDDRVITAIPFSGPGMTVTLAPEGAPVSSTIDLFETVDVISAYGQFHNGEVYVAAIVDDGSGRQIFLAYGDPSDIQLTPLQFDPNAVPALAANALPDEISLLVDDDRIAVVMSLRDPASDAVSNYFDALGWVFLGPPPPK